MSTPAEPVGIRELPAAEAEARIDDLAEILVEAVALGASVNFLAGFSYRDAKVFWRGQIAGIERCERRLFVASDAARLLATAVLSYAPQPNQPHRAEIGKMLVRAEARRQGLGRRLLAVVEAAARADGRTLLMLDTESGSGGDLLYRSCGWTEIGRVPNHAMRPDGIFAETTMFYKMLGPHLRTG